VGARFLAPEPSAPVDKFSEPELLTCPAPTRAATAGTASTAVPGPAGLATLGRCKRRHPVRRLSSQVHREDRPCELMTEVSAIACVLTAAVGDSGKPDEALAADLPSGPAASCRSSTPASSKSTCSAGGCAVPGDVSLAGARNVTRTSRSRVSHQAHHRFNHVVVDDGRVAPAWSVARHALACFEASAARQGGNEIRRQFLTARGGCDRKRYTGSRAPPESRRWSHSIP
jgi:hypothetical protein